LARIRADFSSRVISLIIVVQLTACASQTATRLYDNREGIFHIVRSGETLFRIGKTYNLSHEELARINGIRDPNQIRVGQRLFIPGARRELPAETVTPTETTRDPTAIGDSIEPVQGRFIWPVLGAINSGYGHRGSSFHDGIDISAEEGMPIKAIDNGEVIYSDELRGYGNMVIVRHANGIVSVYAHNQNNLVRTGQTVTQGEVVANVGSTGRVTGPHLHFEIRQNNVSQDPLRYLPPLCCRSSFDMVTPKNDH
jgi:murein DD-endopeptidase MepM/ murein hydrolase activator NlpD